MRLKRLFLRLLCVVLFLFFILIGCSVYRSFHFDRDPIVLMNQYYRYKYERPRMAEEALRLILKQNPDDVPALMELSQWLLERKDYQKAYPMIRRLHAKLPGHSLIAYQFRYLSYVQHTPSPIIFSRESSDIPLMAGSAKTTDSPVMVMIKKRVIAQKKQKKSQATSVVNDEIYALQKKAYAYNKKGQNKLAYRYFSWVARTKNNPLAHDANVAMTQLVGQQTKQFPTPYYGELYVTPFTQSRFGLTVTQSIIRLGVEQQNKWQTKQYFFNLRTNDNQSKSYNAGELSQLYEDDVQVTGVGLQCSPFLKIPLIAYGEMGAAYDLVYRHRPRWRSDFRGGIMYYDTFGQAPSYYESPKWSVDYYGFGYGDATYFSRYQNNVIGLLKTHQGIRLFQYKSSMVNAYVRGVVVQDVQRLFYNNFAEVGPGIGFIPSNRYNFEIRFDLIRGVYLPAGAVYNPYSKYYSNRMVQLLMYVKL